MKKKSALFVVNSINNGGAERVCMNMANELLLENYSVDFITLKDNSKLDNTYEIDSKINVVNLGITSENNIVRIMQLIFSIRKFNKLIGNKEYNLITSHLPMANMLCIFSKIRNKCIYVFHTKLSSYDKHFHFLFKKIINILFFKRKVVCVSNGVKKELIEKYNFDSHYLETIYNPIIFDEIKNKMNLPLDFKEKYILMVGRFNEAKRQDRMIEVFNRGKFYKKYKLVFCGTGELEAEAKELVAKYKLEKYVYFMGWQSNVYNWIKNAELLVSTSDFEAFPMNLIEAFVCGTKVVSSNCNYGPNEILLGSYANYLVESSNIDEYVEKINCALEDYPNEENPIIKKCQAEQVIQQYLSFMKK